MGNCPVVYTLMGGVCVIFVSFDLGDMDKMEVRCKIGAKGDGLTHLAALSSASSTSLALPSASFDPSSSDPAASFPPSFFSSPPAAAAAADALAVACLWCVIDRGVEFR